MRSVRELEEVVNPLFLHQAGGEIQIALPILNHILALLKRALNLVGGIITREQFLQEVGNVDVLENAATDLTRELPNFRGNRHGVGSELRPARPLRQFHYGSVKVPRRQPGLPSLNPKGRFLPDQLVEIDTGGVLRQHLELVAEQPADPLLPDKAAQQQLIFTERRCKVEKPVPFKKGHARPSQGYA